MKYVFLLQWSVKNARFTNEIDIVLLIIIRLQTWSSSSASSSQKKKNTETRERKETERINLKSIYSKEEKERKEGRQSSSSLGVCVSILFFRTSKSLWRCSILPSIDFNSTARLWLTDFFLRRDKRQTERRREIHYHTFAEQKRRRRRRKNRNQRHTL